MIDIENKSKRKRKPLPWMTSPRYVIDNLSEDTWKRHKEGMCLCMARSSRDCLCGAWFSD